MVLASMVGIGIIYHVMAAQDAADDAGVKFTKMNDGLLLSSIQSAEGGTPELKIIVKFKYSEWQKDHPKQIGKVIMSASSNIDEYEKQIDFSKLPSSKTIGLEVPVKGKFTVHLNSYATDDGTQVSGVNGPEKEPETVRIKVP